MVKHTKIDETIEIPSNVSIKIDDNKQISVKGKLGTITKDFSHARTVQIKIADNHVTLHADFPRNSDIALVITLKNLINNMFLGVQFGYEYRMKIAYAHFPITLEPPKKGSTEILVKNFIGERAPRITHTVGDVTVKANKDEVIVNGVDKGSVGQTCANIQKICRIKEKDRRVFQDGIYVYERLLGDKQLWVIR